MFLRPNPVVTVLQQISEHIRECHARAADARRCAAVSSDPERKADYEMAAQSWCRLADSYAMSEQLERHLLDWADNLAHRGEWRPVNEAPFDRDLEIAVIKDSNPHALVFPCRRILGGWMKAETRERIKVRPTHWRDWREPSTDAAGAGALRTASAPRPREERA